MHCEFVVPGLLSCASEARFPALELLLARGRRRENEARQLEAWLGAAFELDAAALPAGALTLAAEGAGGDAAWMRADPVHLRLMRDRVLVAPAESLPLEREESEALGAAINRHFTGSFELKVVDARRWCARAGRELTLPGAPALAFAGAEAALARDIDPLLNEIQMLLQAHPVNAAREARGQPAINSLWLWGGGRLPNATSRWSTVLADEPLARGLARVARASAQPLPRSAASWLERSPEAGRTLAVLDALRVPAVLGESGAFEENLGAMEAAWFAPVLAALRAGRVGMVSVHVPDGGASFSFETIRGDLRRFWRRPRALGSYA